ncbi:MAG: glycosyltransferase [Micrococcales bacterium]|nr:glycosyltransferase [Micrococcales bacterium]
MPNAAQTAPERVKVVMLSAASIELDNRIHQNAKTLQAHGYDVVVTWGDQSLTEPLDGEFDGVPTVTVPVRFYLRDRQRYRLAKLYHSKGLLGRLGYHNAQRWREAAQRLAVREMRTPTEGARAFYFRKNWHRVRSKALSLHEARIDRRRAAWDWRRELAHMADLEVGFGDKLMELAPDIIHVGDLQLLWGAVNVKLLLAKQSHPAAVIYDARRYVADMPLYAPHTGQAFVQMQQAAIEQVDGVMALSQPLASLIQTNLSLAEPPSVVPVTALGSTTPGELPAPALRELLVLPDDVPLLVYFGHTDASTDFDSVLTALRGMPELHLALVCLPSVRSGRARSLAAKAKQEGFLDRLHLVDPVSQDQTVGFLASATMGICPLDPDQVGNQLAVPEMVLDYLAAGLPVVASDLPALRELVNKYAVGAVFQTDSATSVAAAIEQVLAQHKELVAATTNQQMWQDLGPEAGQAALISLYQQVAASLTTDSGNQA